MNIALGLSGFIRNEENIYNITHFFNRINTPELRKLTVYYSCPSKIEETDDEFDKEYILNLFKKQENEKLEINISFRKYNKQTHVDFANELGLPHILDNYHSHRRISCINSLAETAKTIDKTDFNFIIFSRLDSIIYVLSINKMFDNNSVLYNSAYVWRSHPYDGESMNHVEDRFFICSNECTPILKDLLSLKNKDIHNMLKNGISSEEFVGNVFNKYENIHKYSLRNMEISDDIYAYMYNRISIKYSKEFLDKH
jgi:hypothetical protein